MVEIIGVGIVLIFVLLWVVQATLFYYLDSSNDHSILPIVKLGIMFRLLTFYEKKLKTDDERIRKLRDLCLRLSGYTLIIGILFVVAVVIFDIK